MLVGRNKLDIDEGSTSSCKSYFTIYLTIKCD